MSKSAQPLRPAYFAPAYLAPPRLCPPPRMPAHPAARAVLEYLIEIHRVTYAFERGPRLLRACADAGLGPDTLLNTYAYV